MKAAIVLFPGINRERDMAKALRAVMGREPLLVWHGESTLPQCNLVVVPGGFSYGDYLRCGAIAARSPIMADIVRKAETGLAVMGICNGFQILTEARLLPGALVRNAGLKFICRDVHLRVENARSRFTRRYAPGQVIRVPVAHGEGNYVCDPEDLNRLESEGRVLFRYCDANGALTPDSNVNGSVDHIAGIINERGNVMGMMPHPEDHTNPMLGSIDGRALFESVLEAA